MVDYRSNPLYVLFPNGPLLTRLAIDPLLALATYAAVRGSDVFRTDRTDLQLASASLSGSFAMYLIRSIGAF